MMAVTGMAMSASAYDSTQYWTLRRVIINGYISSESISSTNKYFTPTTNYPIYGAKCVCSSFSSSTRGGQSLKADYWLCSINVNGNLGTKVYKDHKLFSSTGEKEKVLSPKIYEGYRMIAEYSIDNPYVLSCYMSGNITASFG